jgi:outer membrane protein assembly factor BamB
MRTRLCTAAVLIMLPLVAGEWPQFRGVNSSGVSDEKNLPIHFGPDQNMVWKTPLPPGHSSPVFSKTQIFVSAYDKDGIYLFALDRKSGKEQWRKSIPRPRIAEHHKSSTPASPSPVTDGENVYALYNDFGLISFDRAGKERWRLDLGAINNPFGLGTSPVLAGNTLLLNIDAESGSYFLGLNKDTGKQKWRRERPDFTRGFSTPVLYKPANEPLQVLVAGSYSLVAYAVETGEPIWWVNSLTWQLKPTPVIHGDTVYVLGWAGGSDEGAQENVPGFPEILKTRDTNKDGKLTREEIADERLTKDWAAMDLDRTGFVELRDWKMYQRRKQVVNAVNAIRLGGHGDMTDKSVQWRYYKSLPNVPSPLYYEGVLYMTKEGGIMTALDAASGKVLKQARLTGALGDYYASPVAADGRIYATSHEGKVVVIKPGAEWEILAVNTLNEPVNATPAFVDGRIFIRTHENLYCFANK